MSDSLPVNPYAPPQAEHHTARIADDALLQARFFVDDHWQRKIAYDLIMPGGLLLTSSMLVLVVGIFLGAVFAPLDWPGMQNLRYMAGGGLIGFPAGAVGAVLYHIIVHRWLQWKNLQRLWADPVLQARGEWLLEADMTELRIQTTAGITRYPLTEIWWHPIHRSQVLVLVQAPGPIPIGVPRSGDLEPPNSQEFSRLLRLRVQRLPFT